MAATPKCCISGCAQWWPERIATPSRSSRVARSCACAPSTRKRDHRGLVAARGRRCAGRRSSPALRSRARAARCSRASTFGHAERRQVVDRGAQADEAGDVRRAGLELVRRVVEHGALEAHLADHLAAADEGRHRGEVLAPRPQRAGAGRAAHLVAGEGVEIAADRGDVDGAVRRGLRAVDDGDDAAPARFAADLAHRVDRAEHVGDVRRARAASPPASAARTARRGRARRRASSSATLIAARRCARRPAATARCWRGAPCA